MTDPTSVLEQIDQRAFTLRNELEPLRAALMRARGYSPAAASEGAAELQALRGQLKILTADFWMGLAQRSQIAPVRSRLDALEQTAREQAGKRAAEVDEAGSAASTIAERMQPLELELNSLAAQRDVAERAYLREAGESAGRQYRAAIEQLGERWSVVATIAAMLATREARVSTGRQSFGSSTVSTIEGIPVFNQLACFKDAPYTQISVQVKTNLQPLHVAPGNVVISPAIAASVVEKLTAELAPKT